jgi:hypothetical protein
MSTGVQAVVHRAATTLHTELLAAPPTTEQPHHVGFDVDGQHVGPDPNGHRKGRTGPAGYRYVADVRKAAPALLEAGARDQQDLRTVGGGRLAATPVDADGDELGRLRPE